MALAKLVKDVNTELSAVHADMVAHRENPRMIRLAHSLIRLTNTEEDNAKLDAEKPAAPVCPHEIVNRKTGKCVACGQTPEEEE